MSEYAVEQVRSDDEARFVPEDDEGDLWGALCPHPVAEHEALREVAAYLRTPEVQEQLRGYRARREYPEEVVRALWGRGLGTLFGEATSALHLMTLNAITARASGGLGITVGVNSLALLAAYIGAEGETRDWILERVRGGARSSMLLTELPAGSDLRAVVCRATPEGAGYRVEGEKHMINGGQRHDLLFVLVRTGEGTKGAHSVLVVERGAGVEGLARWDTLPAPGADISGVRFRGVFVPAERRLGVEGDGMGLIQKTLSMSRGGIGGLAAGVALEARAQALRYTRRREVYGAPVVELGPVAAHVAKADACARIACAVSLRGGAWVSAKGLKAAHHTAVSKYMACWAAERAVEEGRKALGGRALVYDLPFARLIPDVTLYGVFDGTSHVMLQELAVRLGQEPSRGRRMADKDTCALIGEVYVAAPTSLLGLAGGRAGTERLPLEAHARNLAALPGEVDLGPLVDWIGALLDAVEGVQGAWRWGEQAEVESGLAEVYAAAEAALALVELHDPERRVALGLPEVAWSRLDRLGYRHALGWWVAEWTARLGQVVGVAGISGWLREPLASQGGLDGVAARALAGHLALRAALRDAFGAPSLAT